MNLPKDLQATLDYAIKHETMIITTIEAFHLEPELAYKFFQFAANNGVEVVLAPIETSDKQFHNL